MKTIKLIVSMIFFLSIIINAQTGLTLNSNTAFYIEDGVSICADKIKVNSGGTFISEDSSGICQSATLYGDGLIQIGNLLAEVELYSFEEIFNNDKSNIRLLWSKTEDASKYRIQLSRDSYFLESEVDSIVSSTSFTIAQPTENTTYYWRVKGLSDIRMGPWSDTWNFTTSSLTNMEDVIEIPTEFTLYQNHPNPFNPTTKINYAIPQSALQSEFEATNVKLVVYDILGNEVAVLVNVQKPPGNYSVEFDASGLTSGMYIYRIQAGGFIDTKKMILLK